MNTQKRRIATIILVLCNLFVYAGAIGAVVWNNQQTEEIRSAKLDAWLFWSPEGMYADSFRLVAVARPEVECVQPIDGISMNNLDIYTRVEYSMEFPPFEEREWGTIYFVPDPSGDTQKVLDRLNKVIAENDEIVLEEPLIYPITVKDVIYNHEAVKALRVELKSKDVNSYARIF
ncbi:MAG: hypothetical protein LBP24_00580 [Coriobacteriales bacterium]|jgi:hypothetical protein|nr:hypothetical protein [Coriobacteriales bacterium]